MTNAELLKAIGPELGLLLPELDEKARRLTLGAVARAAGDGGIGAVAKMTGASWQTVANGAAELESGTALVSHLAEHGITAMFETVGIDGSSVGKVFEAYVKANAIDLLVMGAYRHSRLNEYVWGGASSTVIGRPPCWVMMSH